MARGGDLGDLSKYFARLGNYGMREAANKGVARAAIRAQMYLHARTAGMKIYDRGWFLSGRSRAQLEPGAWRVFNRAPNANFVERGRRPGARRPPSEPIFEWLLRRGLSEDEARRATFPVAMAIAKRGIKARPVLHTRTSADAMRQFVVDSVLEALDEALRK